MQLRTEHLVPVLSSLILGFGNPLIAQEVPAGEPAPVGDKPPAPVAATAIAKATDGLPPFLLLVPGGKTVIGMPADKLIEAVSQSINPARPEMAAKSPDRFATQLRRCASELGRDTVDVPTFMLGKWPVTNREYAAFVTRMQAMKAPVLPPFHWWRWGRKDDYDAKLEDIQREFPKDDEGPERYWRRHGATLPWALKDDKGQPIDDLPVVMVSYRDAMVFAGWLGMRLPTEAEWTRAARGDSSYVWPWGGNKEIGDVFSEKALAMLQLKEMRDQRLKPVGQVAFATGPFGHVDMVGQVWELTAVTEFRPLAGKNRFDDEWKRLQKDKLGALLQSTPEFKDARVVLKGGSYLSAGEPITLHIDARTSVAKDRIDWGFGFRVAKSLKPGFDMLYSLLRGPFNKSLYAPEQDIDLDNPNGQVGAERYVLGPDGFPTEYHAISWAPVNWLSKEKNLALDKLIDGSQASPIVVGTLATTAPITAPAAPAGHFTVSFRKAGMPRELAEAIKLGHREVQAALKAKDKGEDKKDKEGDEKKKTGDWRSVLARYGLTEQDLEPKDAVEKLKFVRLGTLEVPTDKSWFALSDNEGNYVGLVESKTSAPTLTNAFPPEIALEAAKGKDANASTTVARFRVGVPVLQGNDKRVADLQFSVQIATPPPSATAPWRSPAAGK